MYWTAVTSAAGVSSWSPWESAAESVCCAICSEDPKKYGLLENCNHVFCLDCIREWRRQREQQDRVNLRRCPICRVESYLIVPSEIIPSASGKIEQINIYKASLQKIPCKHFSASAACPFGSSCLYLHAASDPTPPPRILRGADGRKKAKTHTTLSDYF
jgi:E3 ubiquitin-protein ligase makorin